ncbi:MAG: DUF1840 domain-containing protein [Limnohabitans sp.]|nr:DUF1840 domain-containing protein [Limnohabitans sp.]
MLYKFKSKATGNLIMLEADGDRIMQIIGKSPSAKGILEVEEMAQALQALEQATQASQQPLTQDDNEEQTIPVSLRQRSVPFMDMIRRCIKEKQPIVWGV